MKKNKKVLIAVLFGIAILIFTVIIALPKETKLKYPATGLTLIVAVVCLAVGFGRLCVQLDKNSGRKTLYKSKELFDKGALTTEELNSFQEEILADWHLEDGPHATIEELKTMLDDGVISQAQFSAVKKRVFEREQDPSQYPSGEHSPSRLPQ
jgi:hypothetical protein